MTIQTHDSKKEPQSQHTKTDTHMHYICFAPTLKIQLHELY